MRTLKLKDNNYWDTSSIMHNKFSLKELLNSIFPIGKVEIFYDDLDHSNYFGFTWERCSLERSPIGYNPSSSDNNYKTIGKQFGEKGHVLSVGELAEHTHSPSDIGDNWVPNSQSFSREAMVKSPEASAEIYVTAISKEIGRDAWKWGASGAKGSNQAHNTIHPVEVMAFWKRVS